MTFKNCYIVLSLDQHSDIYSDEFTCDKEELLSKVRDFIEQKGVCAVDLFVFVDDEDGCLSYKTMMRHDTIKTCIDDAMKSVKSQLEEYINEHKIIEET